MGKILETVYHPPVEIRDPDNVNAAVRAIRNTGSRKARIFYTNKTEIDITDHRWTEPTHRWLLTVHQDGSGLVNIKATAPDSAIHELGAGQMRELVKVIRSDEETCLMGWSTSRGRRRALVFKTLRYIPD